MRLGIIDVGTNSLHLLIGTLGRGRAFHVLLKERELAKLGEHGLAANRLAPRAMRRAIKVLQRYASTLRRLKVDRIEAVATSAVREAANGTAFMRQVRAKTGLPLRVITGREEARLIYLGIAQAQPLSKPALIVTIGGGSAQVIVGDGAARPQYLASLPLGAARLSQQFLRRDPVDPRSLERLTLHVRRAWEPVAAAVRRNGWGQALGGSAIIDQLMLAARFRKTGRRHASSRLSLTRRSLQELVDWLARSTARQRKRLRGLDPRREDLALPAAVTLLVWMEQCGVKRLTLAGGSLREGLVLDHMLWHHLAELSDNPRCCI